MYTLKIEDSSELYFTLISKERPNTFRCGYEFKKKMSPFSYDVGVDQNDYKPISYNKFLSIISKQVNEYLNQK